MRLFRTILILLIIVGFPILSWIYLKTGADWRKSGWEEMSDIIPVPFPDLVTSDSELLTSSEMRGTYFIAARPDSHIVDDLVAVAEQFGIRDDVRFLVFSEQSGAAPERWQTIDCRRNPCDSITGILFREQANVALVDSALQLRRRYNLDEPEDLKKLIEHGAILFPTEKREKIELIRNRK